MKHPDKDSILKLLENLGVEMTRRDIANAFDIKGEAERVHLKDLLKELEEDGLIVKEAGKTYKIADSLPSVCMIEVSEIDIDGDLFAQPVEWNTELQGPAPRIEIVPEKTGHHALTTGDRALARLRKAGPDIYEAFILKKVDGAPARVVGFIKQIKNGFVLSPVDRRAKHDFDIATPDLNGAGIGQIVVAEIIPARFSVRKKVRVVELIGEADDPKAISLMALYEAGLRPFFPDEVIHATDDMEVPPLGNRTDLRDFPLVTIDGKDARDFDDAVFAEPDTSPENEGGYHLIVAIADVAHYVTAGSPLDKEAYLRGNSTYFPDRVLPMLPEKLSNDLCSLRPHEPRATLAVHMWIDADGKLLRHQFVRGLMMSRARLTYEQVQAAMNGETDDLTAPLMDNVIRPLYAAWKILDGARIKRGALDLDIPERKIVVNDDGLMTGVAVRERLDSHKVIEEFMILANVAAAEALEAKTAPCIYRIHDRPTGAKLMSATSFLDSFGLSLPKGGVANPGQLNHLLEKAKEMPMGFLISEIILRAQAQAVYHPDNIGHFGLALTRYAHFTSPIRRYADLIVHRSLIAAYNLGDGGLNDHEKVKLTEIAENISATERTSAEAERNAVDRFTAAYLRERLGREYEGRISGVTRFGLFIKLLETGADGLIPIRSLGTDFFVHDEAHHALVGRRTGRVFRLGAPVLIRVVEADPMTGSSIFELVGSENGADVEGYKPARGRPGGGYQQNRPPFKDNRKNDGDRKKGKPEWKGEKSGDKKPWPKRENRDDRAPDGEKKKWNNDRPRTEWSGERKERTERPDRSDRPARSDRPQRQEGRDRPDWKGEKSGDKKPWPKRENRDDRAPDGEKKKWNNDRPRTEWSGERKERTERPDRSDRPARSDRPQRQEGRDRPDWKGEKSGDKKPCPKRENRDDRAPDGEKKKWNNDRPRTEWSGEKKERRPERPDRPTDRTDDRPRPASRPSSGFGAKRNDDRRGGQGAKPKSFGPKKGAPGKGAPRGGKK